ncbi:hypothetical protein HPP92_008173 [Vanilla planifolia]|uniref:Agenet-like domain-containing protein n=1 Tax=Vanilla planifolia TaxID=51239 RepID=A0A835RNV9_VANPL|nr:hypothetical protein HPP92_008173 [Vanilla planifolia]
MRFEKGTQVKVREKGESPCGSWRPGRIGNRHTCVFKYYNFPQDASLFVKEVPRKVLRPCHPAVLKRGRVPGDVVEIFENNSWKLAEFLGTLERSVFVIRLIGSSTEIQAHSRIRIPCAWKDNSCVEFPMESAKQKNAAMNSHSRAGNLKYQIPQSCVEMQTGDDLFSAKYDVYAEQQYQFTGRMKKRQDARITPGSLPKKRAKLKENEKCYKLKVQHMSTQKLEKFQS